ncbi:tetratricopeptide repeat protein [Terriglobus sp. TAA 43]|uniref:tetratricopeptide repeat protein n=1 Tax=Terriglobus sp. TAA 43 TaxID=278961 RepID=UPI0012ED5B0D|nr:tetratricopeptide repeat protein [Terriglobus sp. TAA 43]
MKRKQTIAFLCCVIAVCIAYANHWHNGFHFDDFHTVIDNPHIRSLHNLPRFFTDTTTFSVLPANQTYRPLVSASLAMDYALGNGYVPTWFHLGTFLIFLVLLASMFVLCKEVLKRAGGGERSWIPALLATVWFGLHPAMAETVNYIIQRGDLYSTCGVVAALAIYARGPNLRRTGLYLLPFALAMLSKPPAVVFPALLIGYCLLFEKQKQTNAKGWLLVLMPSTVVAVAALVLQSAMTPKSYAPTSVSGFAYRITQPFVLLRYFGSFFLPIHLNVDTDLPAFDHVSSDVLWGFLFLAVVTAAIVVCTRRVTLRPIAFGLVWFLVGSFPTSFYVLSEVENDHRMFLPFVGLMLAVVWAAWLAVEQLAIRRRDLPVWKIASVCTIALLCAYGYGTWQRNKVWHDEDSLWLDDVQKSPRNGRGLMIYGLSQMGHGNYPVALAYFDRAATYTPNYPSLEINLGVVNGAMFRSVAAEQHFQRAIALAPADDQTHFFYGRWLHTQMRLSEALQQLGEAVRLNPARLAQREELMQTLAISGDATAAHAAADAILAMNPGDAQAKAYLAHPVVANVDTWLNVSLARYQAKDYPGTITAAEKVLALNPKSAAAYNNIAAAYAGMGQWKQAVENVKHALDIDPTFQLARNNLAAYSAAASKPTTSAKTPEELVDQSLAMYRERNFTGSIASAKAALAIRPGMAEAWNNIAASEAELKHWDAAVNAAKQAVALKPDFQLAKNNLAWALAEQAKRAGSSR